MCRLDMRVRRNLVIQTMEKERTKKKYVLVQGEFRHQRRGKSVQEK